MIDGEHIRDLSFEERSTWSACTTCGAGRGERCRLSPGSTEVGVHIGRLRKALIRVRVIPIHSALPAVKSNDGASWIPATEFRR